MDNQMQARRMLLAKEFSIWELGLYMDTHPGDATALQLRQQYQQDLEKMKKDYEAHYGPLEMTSDDVRGSHWTWVDNPWPWDYKKEA